MKKLLVLLLVLLLVGTLAACDALPFGGNNDTANGNDNDDTPPQGIVTLPAELPEDDDYDDETPDDVPHTEQHGDFTVIHDLVGFTLIDHDLASSDLLEPLMLRSVLGAEFATVTIISDWEELIHENGWIFVDAWAIEIYYFTRRHETAVESVIGSFEADYESGYFFPDSYLALGDVHATPDENMAILSLVEELTSGHVRVLVYLAQVVPGTRDVVLMEFVFYPHLWEAQDEDVLSALSHHIGIDLSVYLSDFVSSVV